jgi:hypothetical protein
LFFDQFNEYLDALLQKCGRPIIMGDFNFHMENENDPIAQRFASLCRSKGFKQHVESSTHIAGGILDLVLTAENTTDSLQIILLLYYILYYILLLLLLSIVVHTSPTGVFQSKKNDDNTTGAPPYPPNPELR